MGFLHLVIPSLDPEFTKEYQFICKSIMTSNTLSNKGGVQK